MSTPQFDHYTIKVSNLETSCEFYENVIGLKQIKNRTEKPHIRWFSLGTGELHVVTGDTTDIQTNVGVHLALKVEDFDDFLTVLDQNKIPPHSSKGEPNEYTTRADGVHQVYFQDPDGYWIEVNDAD